MAFSGEYMVPIQDAQKLERKLNDALTALAMLGDRHERELADMTKQRDALAEALKKIYNVSVFDWDTMPEGSRRKYREVVLKMADGALSMKKGGSDE
jgi:hypothetical protein